MIRAYSIKKKNIDMNYEKYTNNIVSNYHYTCHV